MGFPKTGNRNLTDALLALLRRWTNRIRRADIIHFAKSRMPACSRWSDVDDRKTKREPSEGLF
jgi:hypothetical protein